MRVPVIGLEIHIQLLTQSKMFCRCKASFGDPPNTNICPVCMGYPGALPVPNAAAVRMGILLGTVLNGTISYVSDFSRKNYFYPDLPKGYQITQDVIPLVRGGSVLVDEEIIQLERIHIEEDSAKMLHEPGNDKTLINYNRAGVCLLEIVTLPCIHIPESAGLFLEKLQQIARYLGISTGKMEEGALRCDVNVSLSNPDGSLGKKVEVKNLNSFRSVVSAIHYEIERQGSLLDQGQPIITETRTWDEEKNKTLLMRVKDTKSDYRYFPEPDLQSLVITDELLNSIKETIPELPDQAYTRLQDKYGLSPYDAKFLTNTPDILRYFDTCMQTCTDPKLLTNWISSELFKILNEKGVSIEQLGISEKNLVELLSLIQKGTISGKMGKDVLVCLIETGESPSAIVEKQGLLQVSNEDVLRNAVSDVLLEFPAEVKRYQAGEDKLFGLFMGQCMKKTKGKGNPTVLTDLLKEVLKND